VSIFCYGCKLKKAGGDRLEELGPVASAWAVLFCPIGGGDVSCESRGSGPGRGDGDAAGSNPSVPAVVAAEAPAAASALAILSMWYAVRLLATFDKSAHAAQLLTQTASRGSCSSRRAMASVIVVRVCYEKVASRSKPPPASRARAWKSTLSPDTMPMSGFSKTGILLMTRAGIATVRRASFGSLCNWKPHLPFVRHFCCFPLTDVAGSAAHGRAADSSGTAERSEVAPVVAGYAGTTG